MLCIHIRFVFFFSFEMLVFVKSGVKGKHNMKGLDDSIRNPLMYGNVKDVAGYSTILSQR